MLLMLTPGRYFFTTGFPGTWDNMKQFNIILRVPLFIHNFSEGKSQKGKLTSPEFQTELTDWVVSQLGKLLGFHLRPEPWGKGWLLQQCSPGQNYKGRSFPGLRLYFNHIRPSAKSWNPSAKIYGLPREPRDFLVVSAFSGNWGPGTIHSPCGLSWSVCKIEQHLRNQHYLSQTVVGFAQ